MSELFSYLFGTKLGNLAYSSQTSAAIKTAGAVAAVGAAVNMVNANRNKIKIPQGAGKNTAPRKKGE